MVDNCLIVIDCQNDFFYGTLGTPETRAIVPNILAKIEGYVKRGEYICFTKDLHHSDYDETLEGQTIPRHCISPSDGMDLIGSIQDLLKGYYRTDVFHKSTFGSLDLLDEARDFWEDDDEVVTEIIGVCTDICVLANVVLLRTALPNSRFIVDASCCAGTTKEAHEAALRVMKSLQIEVINENT